MSVRISLDLSAARDLGAAARERCAGDVSAEGILRAYGAVAVPFPTTCGVDAVIGERKDGQLLALVFPVMSLDRRDRALRQALAIFMLGRDADLESCRWAANGGSVLAHVDAFLEAFTAE